MTPQSLRIWLATMNLNQTEGAKALGLNPMTMNRYFHGKSKIPKYIALACAAIENNLYSSSQNLQKETIK